MGPDASTQSDSYPIAREYVSTIHTSVISVLYLFTKFTTAGSTYMHPRTTQNVTRDVPLKSFLKSD
eukprot:SAG31_NODE_3582_length_4100_cov_3.424394_1_plen_66_part_00